MKNLFILFFLCLGALCFSQTKTFPKSFVLHGNISETKKTFYIESIEKADLEQFRLRTHTTILKFKNGFTLELMPAKDLLIKGIVPSLNINNYEDHKEDPNYKLPVFEILDSGWLTAEVQNNSK